MINSNKYVGVLPSVGYRALIIELSKICKVISVSDNETAKFEYRGKIFYPEELRITASDFSEIVKYMNTMIRGGDTKRMFVTIRPPAISFGQMVFAVSVSTPDPVSFDYSLPENTYENRLNFLKSHDAKLQQTL